MKYFTARSRITIGLASLLVSVLCTTMMLGIVPKLTPAILAGRAQLCETIAVSSSDYISHNETLRLEHLLKSIVERSDDVLSAGVRRADGELLMEVGEHAAAWNDGGSKHSTETHVHVPIRSGSQEWGSIELRFRPLEKAGLAGFWENSWVRMTLFVGAASYILFFVYLGMILQHLDPSKAAPQRVRAALDSLAEGLLVIDCHQQIVLANQAFANWVGLLPEKLIGIEAARFNWVTYDHQQPLDAYPWVEAIERERPLAGVMLGLAIPDEPVRVLMANASPVLGHDGKYRGVLVSFDDVTQLEVARRDLKVAQKAAEDASQAKSDFLARMSHEIRTPMNAILGFTDVLRRGFDESIQDRQQYHNTIHASGEHLLALINDILDLSKIESGRMELELCRHSPHQLILQVVSLLRSVADGKGIQLAFESDGPLPETILTDSVRLRQTIMNLAGNAIKFTDRGGVRIVARVECNPSVRSAPARLSLINPSADQLERAANEESTAGTRNVPAAWLVIDSGIGISPDAQQRIFDPFSQADSSIVRRFGGTGLGLAISRQLAKAMGGGVRVTSSPGKGSTFSVTIDPGPLDGVPLINADTALANLAQQVAKPMETIQLPPARILVADDGESNRKLIRLVLTRSGVDVVTVENGQQAVEAATRESFDVILMDMQMPVLDGYSATRRLRDAGYERPIIALTANAMQGDEEKCRAAGCSDFLTKPINIDRLLALLADVLSAEVGRGQAERSLCDAAESVSSRSQDEAETRDRSLLIPQPELDPIECSLPLHDPDFYEIAGEFVTRLEARLAAMQAARLALDLTVLAGHAHWLKGCGGTAGFHVFTSLAQELEQAICAGQLERIDAMLATLASTAARIQLPPGPIARPENSGNSGRATKTTRNPGQGCGAVGQASRIEAHSPPAR